MAAVITYCEWPICAVSDQIKDTILGAFRQLLRPLVRILLRHGISYGEYSETAKTVFVEVASKDFRLSSKKQTISRVSILTGLTRKEVSRITDDLADRRGASNANLNRVGRVLAGWHQDPDFTGPYGLPLELDIEASPFSFIELVKRYSGDIPPKAMLDELKRVGAVTVVAGTRVRVLTRSYIPTQEDPASVQFMGVALRDLAETLDYNLDADRTGGYFERRVWAPLGIDPRDMPEFDALVHEKGQQFLETLDNYLTNKETESEQIPRDKKISVGVGVYLFSDATRSFRDD